MLTLKDMKLFLLFLLLTTSLPSWARLSAQEETEKIHICKQAYNTFAKALEMSDQVGNYAVECQKACDQKSWGFTNRSVSENYNKCVSPQGGGSNSAKKCLEAKGKVNSGQAFSPTVWETCAADCGQAVSEAVSTSDKSMFAQIANTCQAKISGAEGEPVDPNGDFNEDATDTVADGETEDDSEGLEPADSGLPNPNALNPGFLGFGNNNMSQTPIDGGRGANFTGGGGNRGFGGISQGGGGSFGDGGAGAGIFAPIRVDDVPRLAQPVQANVAPAGAGGVPGGGGAMGGGFGAGGAPGPRGAGGAGGPRTSLAGAQLNKVGQNSFWAPGGGGAATSSGNSRKTANTGSPVAAKEKKNKFGPSYVNKSDNSLLRLMGGSPRPVLSSETQSCADNTVFCTHENFFERVERYPSSEIKQTPR